VDKKSDLTEIPPGGIQPSVNDVRLTMFLQGNPVRTNTRHNVRNEERSPPKSAGESTWLPR